MNSNVANRKHMNAYETVLHYFDRAADGLDLQGEHASTVENAEA